MFVGEWAHPNNQKTQTTLLHAWKSSFSFFPSIPEFPKRGVGAERIRQVPSAIISYMTPARVMEVNAIGERASSRHLEASHANAEHRCWKWRGFLPKKTRATSLSARRHTRRTTNTDTTAIYKEPRSGLNTTKSLICFLGVLRAHTHVVKSTPTIVIACDARLQDCRSGCQAQKRVKPTYPGLHVVRGSLGDQASSHPAE